MLRVLYLVSTLKRAGPVNQLYNLLSNIDREVIEPLVLTLSGEAPESRWTDFQLLNIRLESLGLSRPIGVILGNRQLKLMVDQLKPDLLHSQGLRSDHLVSGFKGKMPIVTTLRNYPQLDYPMTYGFLVGRLMVKQHLKALKRFDCCAGVSEEVTNNAMVQYGLTNMKTVHNGIETSHFYRASTGEKRKLRKKLSLPVNGKLWITTGHLTERKNPLFLIKTWKKNYGVRSNQHLIFIGDGDLKKACQNAADAASNIIFVGRTTDVASYLQAGDFYISASRAEGFPNAVLEAMACGLPALLSKIAPHEEVQRYVGEGVRLFESDRETGLVEGIAEMLVSDYECCAESVIGAVNQNFSARIMAANYKDIYLKVSANFIRE